MLRHRVIPALLLSGRGLVKTTRFAKPQYIGDPINAVRIFNDKEVDELLFLDIMASREGRGPQFDVIEDVARECFMPFAYGGGVRDLDTMARLFALGVEKIALNSAAIDAPHLVEAAAKAFGSQSVIVSIDVKKRFLGGYEVFSQSGTRRTGLVPVEHARRMAECGAGELLINSIDRDGTMEGFDIELIRSVAAQVSVPVIACGGAGTLHDFVAAVREGHASAVAAGSMFVFQGRHRAVLITYPEYHELEKLLEQ
jgi:imidazole glycerol-phosphate synthase subunit HisF